MKASKWQIKIVSQALGETKLTKVRGRWITLKDSKDIVFYNGFGDQFCLAVRKIK